MTWASWLRRPRAAARAAACALVVAGVAVPAVQAADRAADASSSELIAARAGELARRDAAAAAPQGVRIEVEVGAVDPRLRLAPCARITPYLPPNTRLWGATRLGVRCDEGARWQVFVPLRVRVWARSTTLARDLPAGTVLEPAHLIESDAVDLAGAPGAAVRRADLALGRALSRALRAGDALRETDLKPRQWFAAGDPVRVRAVGNGFTVLAGGEALAAGIEGALTRVRLDSGRVVSARPSGPRQVEVAL